MQEGSGNLDGRLLKHTHTHTHSGTPRASRDMYSSELRRTPLFLARACYPYTVRKQLIYTRFSAARLRGKSLLSGWLDSLKYDERDSLPRLMAGEQLDNCWVLKVKLGQKVWIFKERCEKERMLEVWWDNKFEWKLRTFSEMCEIVLRVEIIDNLDKNYEFLRNSTKECWEYVGYEINLDKRYEFLG